MTNVKKLIASISLGIAFGVAALGVPTGVTSADGPAPAVTVEDEVALADGVWKNPKTGAVWVIYEGALYRVG